MAPEPETLLGGSRDCQSRQTRHLASPGHGFAQRNRRSKTRLAVPPEVGAEPLGDHPFVARLHWQGLMQREGVGSAIVDSVKEKVMSAVSDAIPSMVGGSLPKTTGSALPLPPTPPMP